MKISNLAAGVAAKLGRKLRATKYTAGAAILSGGMMFAGPADAQVVFWSEDFEGLTLQPFDVASGGDGTDYTNVGPAGWTQDNSGMVNGDGPSTEGGYDGLTFMDIDSWIGEQGAQIGRDQFTKGGAGMNGTVLVGDPDAWDDFTSNNPGDGFNSFWSTPAIDLTGVPSPVTVNFDSHFAAYGDMTAVVDVTFDGGANYTNLLTLDSTVLGDSTTVFDETRSFSVVPTSNSMQVRFGLVEGGNDWFWAVDNVSVSAIPEPGSLGLASMAGAAAAGLGLRRRRRS